MRSSEFVTPQHLARKAVIYVRQSTPNQVLTNRESLRLQYALKERATRLGWRADDVEVIDSDLGFTGSEASNREGFKELTARAGRYHPLFGGDAPLTQLLGLVPASGHLRLQRNPDRRP
jgi:hypothetical protein